MPIYEYSCGQCGKVTDTIQKVDDPPPEKCPHCGTSGQMSRMVSRTSFVLKGGGWYSDLYSSTKKDSTQSDSGSSGATSTSSAPASGSSSASTPTSGGSSDKK